MSFNTELDEILVDFDLAEASPEMRAILRSESLKSPHFAKAKAAIIELVKRETEQGRTQQRREYLHSLLEGYKNNPSNSNKFYQELQAIVFDADWSGMEIES